MHCGSFLTTLASCSCLLLHWVVVVRDVATVTIARLVVGLLDIDIGTHRSGREASAVRGGAEDGVNVVLAIEVGSVHTKRSVRDIISTTINRNNGSSRKCGGSSGSSR
jgi:hypothetical protein